MNPLLSQASPNRSPTLIQKDFMRRMSTQKSQAIQARGESTSSPNCTHTRTHSSDTGLLENTEVHFFPRALSELIGKPPRIIILKVWQGCHTLRRSVGMPFSCCLCLILAGYSAQEHLSSSAKPQSKRQAEVCRVMSRL